MDDIGNKLDAATGLPAKIFLTTMMVFCVIYIAVIVFMALADVKVFRPIPGRLWLPYKRFTMYQMLAAALQILVVVLSAAMFLKTIPDSPLTYILIGVLLFIATSITVNSIYCLLFKKKEVSHS